MTCGEISSMTHILQIRLRLAIATSLVIAWVCPDLLGEGKEIEKIISILAIMSGSLCKQPEHQNEESNLSFQLFLSIQRLTV